MLKFELSEQMVNIIGAALQKAPYEVVAPVIAELQKQINAQQPKQQAVTLEEKAA